MNTLPAMLDELIGTPGVKEEAVLAGSVGVMALHGGLEAGTAEGARAIADASGASLYRIVQPDHLGWHIPSAQHDPRLSPRLRSFLEHVGLVISLHGFGRRGLEDTVLLGGGNRRVATRLGELIERRSQVKVISDLDLIPRKLRGIHRENPVNLPEHGGVQVELSPGARSPRHFPVVMDAIVAVIAGEMGSICPAPHHST